MTGDVSFARYVQRLRDEARELQCLLISRGYWPRVGTTLPELRECARILKLVPPGSLDTTRRRRVR